MIQDATPAIEVTDLQRLRRPVILDGVSFKVRPAEIFFIIGGSGCGKTTLLRNLVGLIRPVRGEVRFNGRNFTDADSATRREMLRTFGMLFQSGALWTVAHAERERLAPAGGVHPAAARRDPQHRRVQAGAGGPLGLRGALSLRDQRRHAKRAGLARALALDPGIVFFDEPSAGLDPVTARNLDELIVQIRDTFGTTIVIVSHDVDSIFGIADRVIMLDRDARDHRRGQAGRAGRQFSNPKVVEFLTRRSQTAV
jgi:phospholipid/cholesterol/gamma-HCH transport system ATP-binding protein